MKTRRGAPGGRRVVLAAAVVLFACVPTAAASPLLELVGDPAEQGGLAGRFGGASASSAYFNPALLPTARPGMTVGAFVFSDQISIEVGRRSPNDEVALDAAGAWADLDDMVPFDPPAVPTSWLEDGCGADCEDRSTRFGLTARPRQAAGSSGNTRVYMPIGIVKALISDKLVLGFTALLPAGKFMTTSGFYADEREQYFSNSLHAELYSDRLTSMSMAIGFGSQVADWLALGLSFTFNLTNEATAPNFVPDPARFDALVLDNKVDVETTAAPHFGVVITPADWLQLTATFHTVQALTVRAEFSTLLPDGSEQASSKTFTHNYLPWSASLGGNVAVLDAGITRLRLLAGAKIANWETYRDRHNDNPGGDYAWSMTVAPTVGARLAHGRTDVLFDVTYEPSPVPKQDGRTNYVDNDRISMTGGAQQRFEMLGLQWRAGLTAQLHRLMPRTHTKDPSSSNPVIDEVPDTAVHRSTFEPVEPREGIQTNNPGFPGFSSEGWLVGGALTIALLFDE